MLTKNNKVAKTFMPSHLTLRNQISSNIIMKVTTNIIGKFPLACKFETFLSECIVHSQSEVAHCINHGQWILVTMCGNGISHDHWLKINYTGFKKSVRQKKKRWSMICLITNISILESLPHSIYLMYNVITCMWMTPSYP